MLCGGGLPHTNSLWGRRRIGCFVISGTAAGELDTVEFCKAMELHLTVVCISWLGLFFPKRGGCSRSVLGRRLIRIQELLPMEL